MVLAFGAEWAADAHGADFWCGMVGISHGVGAADVAIG